MTTATDFSKALTNNLQGKGHAGIRLSLRMAAHEAEEREQSIRLAVRAKSASMHTAIREAVERALEESGVS